MNEEKSIASLIYWKDGVDKERIERWIQKLQEQDFVLAHVTKEYNPAHGEPCWYIP
jgi:transcription initiation factor IIE alpha subunit